MKKYTITTTNGTFLIIGEKLITKDWGHFKSSDGVIIYFNKQYIVCVQEDEYKDEDA